MQKKSQQNQATVKSENNNDGVLTESLFFDAQKKQVKTKKNHHVSKLSLYIVFLIASISVTSLTVAFVVLKDKPKDQEALNVERQKIIQQDATEQREKSSDWLLKNPVSDNATIDEKNSYYNELLTMLQSSSDMTNTSRIYLDDIKKQPIVLGFEQKDWVATSLQFSGYPIESKAVYAEIVTDLQRAVANKDVESVDATNQLIDEYTQKINLL